MTRISAVVNTRNEAANIRRCLKSLAFADQIVVVDMESEDDTVELVKKYTSYIYTHKPTGYVEPARNYAISKATGDWILIVDADEEIPKTLANKLIAIADSDSADFVRIPRKNIIFKNWIQHSRWWPDYNIRFFKKGKVSWQDEIHSIPITYGEGLNLPAKEELAIIHYHFETLDQYLVRQLKYTQIQAKELIKDGYKFKFADAFGKPLGDFLSRFFAGEGYKDGFHGFAIALMQSFFTLLIYLYVWQKQGFKTLNGPKFYSFWLKQLKSKQKEFTFWHYTMQIHLAKDKSQRFWLKLKRKLLKPNES